MRLPILQAALLAASPLLLVSTANAQWSENFDSLMTGALEGQAGWDGWFGAPNTGTIVFEFPAMSGNQVAGVAANNDSVNLMNGGATSGCWDLGADIFIPNSYSGRTWFVVLNEYDAAGGTANWSGQMVFDSATGMVDLAASASLTATGGPQPYVLDAFTPILVSTDLDNDTAEISYNGVSMYTFPWSTVYGGAGSAAIAAVDLFSETGTIVAYDNLALTQVIKNDDCSGAIDLGTATGAGVLLFDTTGATTSAMQPATCANTGGSTSVNQDIWYSWTAPTTDFYTFDTCGSGYDTKLAVWEGVDCAMASCLGYDDDGPCGALNSVIEPPMLIKAGTACLIQIGGFGGNFGPGVLNITGTATGTNYCAQNANSTGDVATILALGSDLAADDDLSLFACGMPAGEIGFFVVSTSQGLVNLPMMGVSDGFLCLGSGKGRFNGMHGNPGAILTSDAAGSFTLAAIDTTMMPSSSSVPYAVAAGTTSYFTAWFRDSAGTIGNNFTDATQVMWQ